MTAVIRLEEEDDREREAMSRALISGAHTEQEEDDEGVNGPAQGTGLQMQHESEQAEHSEQGYVDEELVRRTDEYHRAEAVQQFGRTGSWNGKGENGLLARSWLMLV